jgi:hypothetical protein
MGALSVDGREGRIIMTDYTIPPQNWTIDMWRGAMSAVVKLSVLAGEDVDDVVTAGWVLGQERAKLRGEEFWPGVHAQYPLMVMTWWPWKSKYGPEARNLVCEKRGRLVKGLHKSVSEPVDGLTYAIPEHNEHMQKVMTVIPDVILVLPIDDLYQRIARDEGLAVTRLLRWPSDAVEPHDP